MKHYRPAGQLEDSLVKSKEIEADDLTALQNAFDQAVAVGDEAAESKAAEALFTAKKFKVIDTSVTGPIELRIAAINIELEAAGVKIDEASMAVDQAEQERLKATADLAFLAYKIKVNELFAAYLDHKKAVLQCSDAFRKSCQTLLVLWCLLVIRVIWTGWATHPI